MTDKTPEALKLAAKLDSERESEFRTIKYSTAGQAAALLRSQHQRIEELEAALRRLRDSTRGLSTEWDVGSDVWSSLENATYLLNRKD